MTAARKLSLNSLLSEAAMGGVITKLLREEAGSMRSTIRKIGNSRGVLIPAALLAECGISDQINLRVEGKCIVIEPLREAREGWFPTPRSEEDVDVWAEFPTDADCEDWAW